MNKLIQQKNSNTVKKTNNSESIKNEACFMCHLEIFGKSDESLKSDLYNNMDHICGKEQTDGNESDCSLTLIINNFKNTRERGESIDSLLGPEVYPTKKQIAKFDNLFITEQCNDIQTNDDTIVNWFDSYSPEDLESSMNSPLTGTDSIEEQVFDTHRHFHFISLVN